ncbi:hypothetical protein BMETH_99315211628, partial [methanotrophic bacterial endosymbiont of Bathymodiolus sp.]
VHDIVNQKHGGKRKGAGRPATGRKETIVVRIDSGLLQAVNDLKKGVTLNQVVTTNQDGADYLAANEKLRIANDALRAKNIKQGNEIRELIAQVEKLTRDADIARATIDRLITEHGSQNNKFKPTTKPKVTHNYNGNTKGFRAEVERITGISQANQGESLFLRKLVLGIPAQAS